MTQEQLEDVILLLSFLALQVYILNTIFFTLAKLGAALQTQPWFIINKSEWVTVCDFLILWFRHDHSVINGTSSHKLDYVTEVWDINQILVY